MILNKFRLPKSSKFTKNTKPVKKQIKNITIESTNINTNISELFILNISIIIGFGMKIGSIVVEPLLLQLSYFGNYYYEISPLTLDNEKLLLNNLNHLNNLTKHGLLNYSFFII